MDVRFYKVKSKSPRQLYGVIKIIRDSDSYRSRDRYKSGFKKEVT